MVPTFTYIHVRFPVRKKIKKKKKKQTANIKKETTQESTLCIYKQHSPYRECFGFCFGESKSKENGYPMIKLKERNNRNGTDLYKRHKKVTKANSTEENDTR